MADTVRLVDYFYIEAADKPGEGARILQHLKGYQREPDSSAHVSNPQEDARRLRAHGWRGVQGGGQSGQVEGHWAEEGICLRR